MKLQLKILTLILAIQNSCIAEQSNTQSSNIYAVNCKDTQDCIKYGKCTLYNGKCSAIDNFECEKTDRCKEYGFCSALHLECQVTWDGCKHSKICINEGRCQNDPSGANVCISVNQSDCKESEYCKKFVACDLVDKRCLKKLDLFDSCDKICKAIGACGVSSKNADKYCSPESNYDCDKSEICKLEKKCEFKNNACEQ